MGKIPDVRVTSLDELSWNTPLYAQNRNSCHEMLKLANHRFLDSAWDVIGILRCSTTERSGLPHLEWTYYQNL